MPDYALTCKNCGPIDQFVHIKEYFPGYPCYDCGSPTSKDWARSNVHFQEDRVRFRKTPPVLGRDGRMHDNWSYALGQPMPESRSERRRIEKEKGIEFTTEFTPEQKEALAYKKHIDSGGKPVDNATFNPRKFPKSRVRERITKWMEDGGLERAKHLPERDLRMPAQLPELK